jgi:hypothetical protein
MIKTKYVPRIEASVTDWLQVPRQQSGCDPVRLDQRSFKGL